MKKLLILLMTLFCCATAFAADADKKPATQEGMNWEISMMPKPSEEEQEQARWSIVVENNVGIYAYDMDSLTFSKVTNGVADKNIIMNVSDEAKQYLLQKGTDLKYGARPLRRAIQRYIEDELSDMLLKSELKNGQTVNIDVKDDKLTFKVTTK